METKYQNKITINNTFINNQIGEDTKVFEFTNAKTYFSDNYDEFNAYYVVNTAYTCDSNSLRQDTLDEFDAYIYIDTMNEDTIEIHVDQGNIVDLPSKIKFDVETLHEIIDKLSIVTNDMYQTLFNLVLHINASYLEKEQ